MAVAIIDCVVVLLWPPLLTTSAHIAQIVHQLIRSLWPPRRREVSWTCLVCASAKATEATSTTLLLRTVHLSLVLLGEVALSVLVAEVARQVMVALTNLIWGTPTLVPRVVAGGITTMVLSVVPSGFVN